jgi:S1-C subfamily serine protease
MIRFLAVIFLILSPSLFAQQPSPQQPNPRQAPTPPPAPKEEPDFELNTALMESTFLIQGQSAQGQTIGTVFVVGRPIPNSTPTVARLVLITAAHVLEQMQGDTAILYLRRLVDEKTNSWVRVPSPLQIRANGQPLWKRHPEVDVAVMYISVPAETPIKVVLYSILADDKMLTDYDVKPGDELRCLGYPLGVVSNDAGFPVLRSGRIASYPLLPTDKTKTFLLDFRVFRGNSGGPVYFVERLRPNLKTFGEFTNYHFIVGLVSEEIVFPNQSTGPYSQEIHQTQLGLATVIHASLIKQTIEMLPSP